MADFCKNLPKNDILIFLDGSDTCLCATKDEIVEKFLELNTDLLISTERNCFPSNFGFQPLHPKTHLTSKYINSGGYIGYVYAVSNMLQGIIDDFPQNQVLCKKGTDQGLFMQYILNGDGRKLLDSGAIKLDHACGIFLSLCLVEQNELSIEHSRVRCKETGSFPCVLHGNGRGKKYFFNLYDAIRNNAFPVSNS